MVVVLTVVFIRGWRRNPGSPVLLMVLCTTLIVWQDPIMNWSPYAVYNPMLLHWPESWPLIMMSPTVEPFIVFGYVTFYFGPYFPAIWILRKLQAKRGPEAFVTRHPLISLGLLILVIGFIFDAILEISLVRTGLYIYSQAIPFGTMFAGTTFQFPLIWESLSVTFVMIPAAILVYRDDTGKSVAEKLAAKAKLFPTKPVLGTFLVMFAIINVSYFAYGGWFWAIKASGLATSVACPWPYPEAKVFDPQGYYEKAGAEGPFSVGKWSTWQYALPNGRPDVEPPPAGEGRCAPGATEWLSRARVVITGRVPRSRVRLGGAPVPRGLARGRRHAHTRPGNAAAARGDRSRGGRRPADRRPARPDGRRVDRGRRQGDRRSASARRTRWSTTQASPPPGWWRRPIIDCGRACSPPTCWVRSR